MNQVIRVTEGWHRAQEGQQCWTWVPQKYQYQMKFSFLCHKGQDSEVTYEPPHLTWKGRAGTAQLDAVPPCSWHQTARLTPGAAHTLWQYPISLFPRQRREK